VKLALEEMTKKAEVTSVTYRYFFTHTTKKDKKSGASGNPCSQAGQFVHAARHSGLKAEYTYCGEDGTGVEVTERFKFD